MKNELKIEFDNTEVLRDFIKKAYFEEGDRGKLKGKHSIKIEKGDIMWTILNGMNNLPIRILNNEVLDGSMKFIVDESTGDVQIIATSIYSIIDKDKYIFY